MKPLTSAPALASKLTHFLIRILDEWLPHQSDLGEELVESALNHLFDNLGRFTTRLRLCDQDTLFFFNKLGWDRILIDELRVNRRDVHGDIARQIGIRTGINQHTDTGTVRIACDRRIRFNTLETSYLDIFTDLGDQSLTGFLNALSAFQLQASPAAQPSPVDARAITASTWSANA